MKICPVRAESFHTDMTMLNSRFSQFCERALKRGNCSSLHSGRLCCSRNRHDRVAWVLAVVNKARNATELLGDLLKKLSRYSD
jgi:hypothetical protein